MAGGEQALPVPVSVAGGEEEVAGADTTLEVADDRCMVPSLELPQSMNSRTMGGRGGGPPPYLLQPKVVLGVFYMIF